jgi:glycosyltransferase involved in cell wall biosynthesis
VLPSERERWGVVVAEAAAAGLVVVVSERVGAAADLLRAGENGYSFRVGDVQALATAFRRLYDAKRAGRLSRMGEVSRSLAAPFSLDNCTKAYREAIRFAVSQQAGHR